MHFKRTTTLNLRTETFTSSYEVEYPNVGKQFDIEMMKVKLSEGRYETLKLSYLPTFVQQAKVIDVVATFTILIPNLKADLTVKSLFDLNQVQFDALIKMYEDEFLPWYTEIETQLKAPLNSPQTP